MSDTLPQVNGEYAQKEYWEQRYQRDTSTFDWFKTYQEVSPILNELIPDQTSRVLILGCGNSTLSEDMYDAGYRQIVNIDYSPTVISSMAKRNAHREEMTWLEMDVRNLDFENGSFDVAIDKGTMDAMLAVKGDVWNPPAEAVANCTKEVDEVLRVLRPHGLFIYLTFGQPHFRKRFLQRDNTTVEIRQLGSAFHYYLYIVRKGVAAT